MAKKDAIRGYVMEAVIRDLVRAAGFTPQNHKLNKQLTNSGRFKGRGATHQIDVHGEFLVSIPFVYPVNLLGEIKGSNWPVRLGVLRDFVSVIRDIQEWYNIDLEKGGQKRFQVLDSKRNTHCGVIFALSGYSKDALQFAWAHGIYTITYESNPVIQGLYSSVKRLADLIKVTKLNFGLRKFLSLDSLSAIPDEAKKRGFVKALNDVTFRVNNIRMIFGMLNGRHLVSMTTTHSVVVALDQTDQAVLVFGNDLSMIISRLGATDADPLFAFSLPEDFFRYYLVNTKTIKATFGFIDLYAQLNEATLIVRRISIPEENLSAVAEAIMQERRKRGWQKGR